MNELDLKKLVEFMLEGDEQSSWELIASWSAKRDSLYFYEEVLTNAMRYVGELWELNEITVADEHIASNVCNLLLARYQVLLSDFQDDSNFKGMFFCIEGEEHSLGIRMVSSLFKENGWNTRYLGANLPVKDAIIYTNRWRPDVIGISISIIYNLPKLIEYVNELNQLDYQPEILVGGRITSLFPLESHIPTNVQVIRDLNSLHHLLVENKLCKELHGVS
ncbi:cobalamin B12-binding domain-containing protein [Bacillus sp. AK128]